jgi:colanic acid/amylovoran biosynthesis protein
MNIEIRRIEFMNKGAQLMLCAVLEQLRKKFPEARFVVAPNVRNAPYIKRAEQGLYQKAWYTKYKHQWGYQGSFIPKKLREMYGIVLDKEIDVVLDAAGFAYSDQWGAHSVRELAQASTHWKKQGTKVILLPQAFGPFNVKENQKDMKRVLDNVDLVFAREKTSYDSLISLVEEPDKIRMAPDFTNLIEGVVPPYFDPAVHQICLIPNFRMIDKTDKEQSEAYLPFFGLCLTYLLEKKQKPYILIHEGEKDYSLAKSICEKAGIEIPIVIETDPLYVKGLIGRSRGTIGSRYHGLVSALSQGVPSLATGWSHKYQMLCKDYDFEEGLVEVVMSESEIKKKIDMIIDTSSAETIRRRLLANSLRLKKEVVGMWEEVFSVICR